LLLPLPLPWPSLQLVILSEAARAFLRAASSKDPHCFLPFAFLVVIPQGSAFDLALAAALLLHL